MSYTWTGNNPLIDGTDYPLAAHINEMRNIFDHQSNYCAAASLSSTQSIPNTTETNIVYNSTTYDPNSNYANGTGTYTIPLTGKFVVTACVNMAPNGTGLRSIRIKKNGSDVLTADVPLASGSFNTACVIATELSCTSSDTINIAIYQSSGGSLNAQSASNFSIHYIGS